MSLVKKGGINLAIVLVATVTALLLLEGVARFLPPPFENTTNAAEICWPPTGWRGRANFTTTVATANYVHDLRLNSQGMHDTDHSFNKPANTFRILLLGDSFVHAIQVREAETAHQVLEDQLNQMGLPFTVEVLSSGVSGWGTGQQLLYYRAEGRHYQPDLVLLMFYLGNDVKDNLPGRGITADGHNCYAPYFTLARNQLDPQPWLYAPGLPPSLGEAPGWQKSVGNLLGRVHQHSQLYAQLEPLLAPEPVQASMLDYYLGHDPTFTYGLHLTKALVQQLAREAQQDDARFGVALIPPLSLVEFARLDAAGREQVYQELPAMRRAEEITPPNEALAQQFAAAGLPALDLLPTFASRLDETGEPLYFIQDKHWTTTGNQLAGATVAQWLVAQGLVPAP